MSQSAVDDTALWFFVSRRRYQNALAETMHDQFPVAADVSIF